ncbi:MAG: TerD family protein [Bacteroidia bacterium]
MQFQIQLNWANKDIDLDLTAFLLAEDKWIPSEKDIVYYYNDVSSDGSVQRKHDDRTGGSGETLVIDTSKVSENISEILLVVTVYQEDEKKRTFALASQAALTIVDDTGKQWMKCEICQNFAQQTAIEVARVYKRFGKWRLEDIQVGYQADLAHFVNKFVY